LIVEASERSAKEIKFRDDRMREVRKETERN
jgi:hypothetical protein